MLVGMSLRHALLGLLAERPGSGWDLLKGFESSLAFVWPATQSQLYTELGRMTDDALIEVTATGARNRKEYAITDAGREELIRWITEVEPERSRRNEALLRVFFLGNVTNEWLAVGMLGLAAAAHQGWSANLYTTASDMFPREAVGAVTGIGGMVGAVGGVLFAGGVGWVLTHLHSYSILFAISATAYLLALLIIRIMVPRFAKIPVNQLLPSE